MSERNPFDPRKEASPEHMSGEGLRRMFRCEDWESFLADALDGVLPAEDHALFNDHSVDCAVCARLLAEAKRGQEWLQFLHAEPETPSDLVERILGKTSGAVAERPLAVFGAPIAVAPNVLSLPVRRFTWDNRLMMTAAMAFFSIALTLNLAGIRITDIRLSDLTPASMENNLTRQFYGVKSQVVRYYDNLRFVYEVESKMRELRQNEDTTAPRQAPQQEKPASNPAGNGHKTGGKLEIIPRAPKQGVTFGQPALACLHIRRPGGTRAEQERACTSKNKSGKQDEVKTLVVFGRGGAERSLA